jgi:glycosyltransferase domain-containing protein
MPEAIPDFTLIVPTFNRPRDFARLLTCLARQEFGSPILVLDSSDSDTQAANAALVETLNLDVRIVPSAESISPFEKFWRGSQEVRTEFCALCADDDVIMVEAIDPLVQYLREHQDFSAAHGLYFTFYDEGHVGLTSIVYSSESLDRDDPVARLHDLFRRYEAVTYGLYRTTVMRDALGRVQPLGSMLGRELLAGAVTVVAGKVARLPVMYYGRSLRPSLPYRHWHPIDFLISSPQALFDDYARYRQSLLESLTENAAPGKTPAELLKVIDLIHIRYLADYVSPQMMDYLLDQVSAGTAPADIMSGVWPRLAASDPVLRPLWSNRTLRWLRSRLAPRLRQYQLRRLFPGERSQIVKATTFGGRPREYRLYGAFLSALAGVTSADSAGLIERTVRGMNAYE